MKAFALHVVSVLSLGLLFYHCKSVESTMVQHTYGNWFDKFFGVDFYLPMMKSSSNTYNSQLHRFQNIWNKVSQDYLAGFTLKNINKNQIKNNPIQIKQMMYYPEFADENILKRRRRDDSLSSTPSSIPSTVFTNSPISTNNITGIVNTTTIKTEENRNSSSSTTIKNYDKLLSSSEIPPTKRNLTSTINSISVITNVSTTSSTTLLVEINKNNYNQQNDKNVGTNNTENKTVDENTKFSTSFERKGPMTIIFLFAILILITGIVLFFIYKQPFRGSRNTASYEVRSTCHSSRDEATPV